MNPRYGTQNAPTSVLKLLHVTTHIVGFQFWKQTAIPFHSNEGQGLFSPVGQDRQWVHRPSPEKVLLVGTKHLALC